MPRQSDSAKDQQLLTLLRSNAREPLSELARKLGVSRGAVQTRISRLERERLIKGYTIISGVEASDARTLSAVVMIEIELKSQPQVVSALRNIPEVVSCHTVSGNFDLQVKIQCTVPSDLDKAIDRIAKLDGVSRTNSIILLARKFER